MLPRRPPVTKTYNARLATRITASTDARLRQLALITRRRISHVLDDVLDAALPTAEELAARLSRLASTGQDREDQHPADRAAHQETGPPGLAATGEKTSSRPASGNVL